MPKTKLPKELLPNWLKAIDENSLFDRDMVLTNSIYYPGSNLDGRFLKLYLGVSHSVVYADPGVKKELFLDQVRKISGYQIILIKELADVDLSQNPNLNIDILPTDFYPPLESPIEIPKAFEEAQKKLTWGYRVSPYIYWVVLQRKSNKDSTHGPERFSLIFIASEGITTYSAIYNSNKLCPKVIVFSGADIGFGHNWTFFEKRGGLFERIVMSNQAGLPKYLFTCNRYNPLGGDQWYKKQGLDLYWEKYTHKIPDKGSLNVWALKE